MKASVRCIQDHVSMDQLDDLDQAKGCGSADSGPEDEVEGVAPTGKQDQGGLTCSGSQDPSFHSNLSATRERIPVSSDLLDIPDSQDDDVVLKVEYEMEEAKDNLISVSAGISDKQRLGRDRSKRNSASSKRPPFPSTIPAFQPLQLLREAITNHPASTLSSKV